MREIVIFADFNNRDRDGFLRLNNRGTIDDLADNFITLVEGLKLLFSDGDLTAEGIVRPPGVEGVWRAEVVGEVRERDPDSIET